MRAACVDPASKRLVCTTVPEPAANPGEVVIKVAAAGVNRADLLQVAGHYPPPPGTPSWPGLEVSGTVVTVGAGAGRWRVGDCVMALLEGGGYAEYVQVRAGQVLPVDPGLGVDLVDAAALPEALCTVWTNLVDTARLRSGEWLLAHGGSGGIGTIAIQIARALGAKVAVTAGGTERTGRCLELGAHVAIDYRSEDFVERITQVSGTGADVVLDVVGAAYLERNLRALAMDGRLVVLGMQKGTKAELDLGLLLAKRATVAGTTLRSRPAQQKARIVSDVEGSVLPMVARGQVRPVVYARLPLAEAAHAHELMSRGEVFGKVLLVP